jgi:hypothetical protein
MKIDGLLRKTVLEDSRSAAIDAILCGAGQNLRSTPKSSEDCSAHDSTGFRAQSNSVFAAHGLKTGCFGIDQLQAFLRE